MRTARLNKGGIRDEAFRNDHRTCRRYRWFGGRRRERGHEHEPVLLPTLASAVAIAPAVQFGGGTLSTNNNQSNAAAVNYASINQWMLQLNH